jgi:dihydrofolate reductase/thymidylate synthase
MNLKLTSIIITLKMITLIACVTNYKGKLAIGRRGNLLFNLKDDMKFFKDKTSTIISSDSKLDKNIVLMGRKTYFSIPSEYRPLKDRINIVLTNDSELIKISPIPRNLKLTKDVYFTDMVTFNKIYYTYNPIVFVIGGSELYNTFLNQSNELYITHVQDINGKDISFAQEEEPDVFMNHFDSTFKLVHVSQKYIGKHNNNEVMYRILHYKSTDDLSEEYKYIKFMNNILNNGNIRTDRTNTGTVSIFGNQMKFDISHSIPLMTTKRVPLKVIIEELLWFCRGDTDAKILQERGVKIWDGNTSREFLDKQGLEHYPEGVLGAGYGFQWRFQGAKYSPSFADTSKVDTSLIGGFDQLRYVENLLKTDPFSRRIVISAWNPSDFDKTALVPCFPAGTLVLTDNGYKKIENVLISDKLYTHKGNWKEIINLQQKKYNDDMYQFRIMCNYKEINVTKEHPFFVKDIIRDSSGTILNYSENPYWCEAKDITQNHVMCLPRNKNNIIPTFRYDNQIKIIDNRNEWFMLGYYLLNGDIDITQEGIFNISIYKDNNAYNILYRLKTILSLRYKDETNNTIRYDCDNIIWYNILRNFGELTYKKKIPEWVQDAPPEYIKWFIEGYISGYNKITPNIYDAGVFHIYAVPYLNVFNTISDDIAYGFQRLYAKLGNLLTLSYTENTLNMIQCKLLVTNKKYLYMDNDYIYFNILNINKRIENTIVYNMEVKDDNSYIVQNVAVHNCHILLQFYVEEINEEKHLSCQFYMRSNDVFLANVFNIISYTILTYILAMRTGMKPKNIIYTCGDSHIYLNHVEQVKEQMKRTPRPFPKLLLHESLRTKDWSDMDINDFELAGYFPYPAIKAPMAV